RSTDGQQQNLNEHIQYEDWSARLDTGNIRNTCGNYSIGYFLYLKRCDALILRSSNTYLWLEISRMECSDRLDKKLSDRPQSTVDVRDTKALMRICS
ncbi:hypothetical protein WA026_012826, partial [Henosepilachna vigintioctopunctata]